MCELNLAFLTQSLLCSSVGGEIWCTAMHTEYEAAGMTFSQLILKQQLVVRMVRLRGA